MTDNKMWLAVIAVAVAILVHALVPRYEFSTAATATSATVLGFDRWSGKATAAGVGSIEIVMRDTPWLTNYRGEPEDPSQ